MNNYSKLYWLTRLSSIETVLILLVILCFFSIVAYYVGYSEEYTKDCKIIYKKDKKRRLFWSYFLAAFSAVLIIFLPSKNDVIFIFAGGKTMNFIENDSSINKLPAQTTQLITTYLDNTIKQIKDK